MPVPARLLALLLCAAMPAGIAGCGDDEESPSGRGETVPRPTQAPPADTTTTPQGSTQPGRTSPDDAIGRVSLGLDKLLRSSSEFALEAQRCVRGDKGRAQECANDAFEDLDKARDEYEQRLADAEEGASSECRAALGRTRRAAAQVVDTLSKLRDAAATGEQAQFTRAGRDIATTLQRTSGDLVAAQAACLK